MANQIQPSIGRVVHYVDDKGQIEPAMITRVWTRECVNLQVLADCSLPYVTTSVVYHEGATCTDGGSFYRERSWHWPERV